MQKIKMSRGTLLTFEEGCNKYLENCRQRNLREGTINHYRQSYLYFYKYFNPKMPIEDIDEQTYMDYVMSIFGIPLFFYNGPFTNHRQGSFVNALYKFNQSTTARTFAGGAHLLIN